MVAAPGDHIVVQGYGRQGVRRGTVVEARRGVERDILVVRWQDGHTSTFILTTGTTVEHPGPGGDKHR